MEVAPMPKRFAEVDSWAAAGRVKRRRVDNMRVLWLFIVE
jgi:hypothetical protein